MFSNCAPENFNEILDEISASQPQTMNTPKASKRHNIANLRVLSSWLFQEDALVIVSRKGGASRSTLLNLVRNPHLSNSLLEQMADYPDSEVRTAIAEHDNLPGHVSYFLSQDESIAVRYAIASNQTTPKEILFLLREDQNPYVIARAGKTLTMIARETMPQEKVVNLNWKENFKAQNTSGKHKQLGTQRVLKEGRR